MGVYYSIYAEARVGNKWYNISPLMRNEDGEVRVRPVLSGQSMLHDAVEELEESCFMRGRPENLSDELMKIYSHDENDTSESLWRGMTFGEYYRQTLFAVNYGKSVKCRVDSARPTRYRGYINKYCMTEYEIGNSDSVGGWLTEQEYNALSDEEKIEYTYYEWNEWYDWYGIYAELVRRVDCLLTFFRDWSLYHIHDADLDERSPTADYVRLIVARE